MRLRLMLQRANRSTKCSWWSRVPVAGLIAATITITGCGVSDDLSADTIEAPTPPTVVLDDVPVPQRDSLALVSGDLTIRVGEDAQETLKASPKPKGGFDLRESPPVAGEGLKTRGWSTSNQTFAVVSKQGAVVLAMLTSEGVSKEVLRNAVGELEERNGGPTTIVPGQFTNYRFWEAGNARLMVCDTMNNKRQQFVTVAIGHVKLMDALRMNLTLAGIDQRNAESVLNQTFAP